MQDLVGITRQLSFVGCPPKLSNFGISPRGVVGTGPFEAAKQRFLEGQSISLCVGWFNEINHNFDQNICLLADAAAARNNCMVVLEINNLDRKGEETIVMQYQVCHALGVAIARGNAKLKLL